MSTYNPIIESKPYKNGIWAQIPIPSDERVIILSVKGVDTEPAVIGRSGGPSIKTIKRNKYDWQTDIDIAKHMMDLVFQAGSSNYVYHFLIKAKFTVQVIKPALIFREQIQDVAGYVKRAIEGGVEDAARGFDINMASELQRKLKEDYGKPLQIDGFEVKLDSLSVDIDEEAKKYFKKIVEVKENENIRLHEAESAKRVGERLEDDTGLLIEILNGRKSAEEIADIRRTLKKNSFNDQLEYARKIMEFVQDMVERGQCSEAEGQRIMRTVLGKKGLDLLGTTGNSEEKETEENTYASFDD